MLGVFLLFLKRRNRADGVTHTCRHHSIYTRHISIHGHINQQPHHPENAEPHSITRGGEPNDYIPINPISTAEKREKMLEGGQPWIFLIFLKASTERKRICSILMNKSKGGKPNMKPKLRCCEAAHRCSSIQQKWGEFLTEFPSYSSYSILYKSISLQRDILFKPQIIHGSGRRRRKKLFFSIGSSND